MNDKKLFIGIIIGILITASIAGAYFLGTMNTNKKTDEIQLTSQPTISQTIISETQVIESKPTQEVENKVDVKTLFIASMNSKQYDVLLSHIDNNVQVRIESSGCCGPLTPQEAVKQLEYFKEANTWDFTPNIIKTKLAQASQYYKEPYIVGIADNKMGVSFKINAENKIDAINLMATYELLIQ